VARPSGEVGLQRERAPLGGRIAHTTGSREPGVRRAIRIAVPLERGQRAVKDPRA
jgi:hypothetical protein